MASDLVIEVPSTSVEFVRAAVAASRDEVVSGTVSFGFTSEKEDDGATYAAGDWHSQEKTVELVDGEYKEAYIAEYLLTASTLGEGTFYMWVKVALGDQAIVRLAGKIKVT